MIARGLKTCLWVHLQLVSLILQKKVTTQEGVQGDGSPEALARGVPAHFPFFVRAAAGGDRGI